MCHVTLLCESLKKYQANLPPNWAISSIDTPDLSTHITSLGLDIRNHRYSASRTMQ